MILRVPHAGISRALEKELYIQVLHILNQNRPCSSEISWMEQGQIGRSCGRLLHQRPGKSYRLLLRVCRRRFCVSATRSFPSTCTTAIHRTSRRSTVFHVPGQSGPVLLEENGNPDPNCTISQLHRRNGITAHACLMICLHPAGSPNMSAKVVSPSSKESEMGKKNKVVRMEEPLWEYMPSAYICVLEGRLLANGDLKARVMRIVV